MSTTYEESHGILFIITCWVIYVNIIM